MFVLADDELFEFCVSCVKFGENRRVFVEFVGSVIFVDLKLSQNPLLPTTHRFTEDFINRYLSPDTNKQQSPIAKENRKANKFVITFQTFTIIS